MTMEKRSLSDKLWGRAESTREAHEDALEDVHSLQRLLAAAEERANSLEITYHCEVESAIEAEEQEQ